MGRRSISKGWTVFILECANGPYYTGMTRDLKRTLVDMEVYRLGTHVSKHPEMFPVKVVFKETFLPFREAFAKKCYMRLMNRKLRSRLILTKKWPIGGPLLEYIKTAPIDELEWL